MAWPNSQMPGMPPMGMMQPPFGAPQGYPPQQGYPGQMPFPGAMPFPGGPAMAPFGMAAPVMPSMPPPPALVRQAWKMLATPEGRTYYFNELTKQTTWEKPEDLKTPFERAIAALPWKEFTDQKSSRKYYYNAETKQTVWQPPDEWKALIEKKERGELLDELPNDSPMSGFPPDHMSPADRTLTPKIEEKKPDIPEFRTREEAEEAFLNMLKEQKIPAHCTWEQAMRATVAQPMWAALRTLAERKQAFTKYIDERRQIEREEQRTNFARIREEFRTMLEELPEIKAGTKYRRALKHFRDRPEYLIVATDKEREDLYAEYVEELRRKDLDQQRAIRKQNVEKFRKLLLRLGITADTKWKEAQEKYTAAPEYMEDESLRAMDSVDFLATFEEHIKSLENEEAEAKRKVENLKRRRERIRREGFWSLLQNLVERGMLSTATKWKEIYPAIKDDERYVAMLGQLGSSPLEMLWDMQYDMEERFQTERKLVTDMMKTLNIVVNIDTSFTIFLAQFSDERINTVDKSILRMVFEEQLAKAEQRLKEEKRREEKRLRKKLDGLKQVFKKLVEPAVTAESTWDDFKPRIVGKADVEGVPDEMQAEVFEKLRKRIEDKLPDSEEEEEREREREREERKKASRRDRSEDKRREASPHRSRGDRERERDRSRERDRDRSRDRDRDRHRERDDRDKDREREKERERDSKKRHGGKHRDRSVGSEEERERERRKRRKEDPNEEIEEGEIV